VSSVLRHIARWGKMLGSSSEYMQMHDAQHTCERCGQCRCRCKSCRAEPVHCDCPDSPYRQRGAC
jgi:hypothetical protein